MKFNHLDVPTSWQHYWTRYPEGYTVMEALITWVSQVDDMVDNVNDWNTYLDEFVRQFDTELQNTVTGILDDWNATGFLTELINEYTNERIDIVENNIEQVANGKIDKAGTGQVTWSNIAQDARENISGGTTAVVGTNAVLDDNIAANALRLRKMDNTDVNLINPANTALILKDDYDKINELGAMATGGTQFYTSGTTTVTYVDNTSPFPDAKMVNATYSGSIGYGANININIENKNTIPVFGLWVRKADIVALGNEGLVSLSFIADNGNIYSGEWLSIFNVQNIGYTSRRTETNYTTTTTVMAEYYGWIFIELRLNYVGDTVKTLNPRLTVGGTITSGTIQTVGYKYVHTQNRLLPHFNYPVNIDAVVPTNEELDQKIKNIELLASTEFTGHEGNIVGDSISAPFGSYATKVEEIVGTGHIYRHAIGGRGMADTVQGAGGVNFGLVFNGSKIDYTGFKFSLIAMGTNDFKLNVPLGTLNTNTNYNFNSGTNILNTDDVTPNSRLNGEETYPKPTISTLYPTTTSNVLVEVVPGEHLLLNKDSGTVDLYWRIASLNNNVQVSRLTTPLDTYVYKVPEGVNQLWVSYPTGSNPRIVRNSDSVTFYGAYQKLISSIIKENPTISLLLMTPLQRDNGSYDTFSVNTAGHKLEDYVNAITEIGAFYGLPVYDAYRNSGVNMLTLDTLTSDGLHPNAIGYTIVGTRLAKWFKDNAVIV